MTDEVLLDLSEHGTCAELKPRAQRGGERRWNKPVPLPSDHRYSGGDGDDSPWDSTRFRTVCHQPAYIVNGNNLSSFPGSSYSEDCLNVNIWTPARPPPGNGEAKWPVLVFIHGGWLQMGSPSHTERYWPEGLLAADGANLDAVVVSIGYRLNIFGFLAGAGLKGNFGFWDQRCALEWIQNYIHFFGGDKDRVTLSGHSAGAYSAHCQLQYELFHTDGSRPLFRNVWLASNAIPAQPKSLEEANHQLEDVFLQFDIPTGLEFEQRLGLLRQIPPQALVDGFPRLNLHTFRAVTDSELIHPDMTSKFRDGTFAKLFHQRGYRLMVGETENEQWLYSKVLPPSSLADLPRALENYYAASVCKSLLALPQYQPKADHVDEVVDAERLYGLITSDAQVRAPIRALCDQLISLGRVPHDRVFRYRIAFRPQCLDKFYPAEAGVTHGGDMYTWWLARGTGIREEEARLIASWLQGSLVNLVNGDPFAPSAQNLGQYVRFGHDGSIAVVEDQYWGMLDQVNKGIVH